MIEPKIGEPFEYEGRWYVGKECKHLDQCKNCALKPIRCWDVACGEEQTPEGVPLEFRQLRFRTWWHTPLRDGHWFSRLYDWFWSDDPIAQRFRIGILVTSALFMALCLVGIGLELGRSGL